MPEKVEALDPLLILRFCVDAVMLDPDLVADFVEEFFVPPLIEEHWLMKLFALIFSLALLAGCSENAVVGTYQKVQDPNEYLTLSGDSTFVMNSGDTGTYKVKNGTVVLDDPAFGTAEGVVDGNIITFPANSSSATAGKAAGVWKQISDTP